jgi:hypothetical protein
MPEIGTSGSMSGVGNGALPHALRYRAHARLYSVNSYKVIMSRRPKFRSTSKHRGSRLRSITASPSASYR